jgi:iron(III) transport system substrate-binding protein
MRPVALFAAVLAAAIVLIVGACERAPGGSGAGGAGAARRVVVYCSADSVYAQPLFDEFTRRTGIVVAPVFDTEATKTTGLVNRMLGEKDAPRADVWWSSEPFGTIRLARAGVLEAFAAPQAEAAMNGWPQALRDADGRWYGFARRARVIVYNTELVKGDDIPKTIDDLASERFRGRAGLALPQFSTVRGSMGALLHVRGEDGFRRLLESFKASGVRILDGNSTVVRAVATGELRVGLTDTDDVYAGQREGWPVDMVYDAEGAFVIPNTLGLVSRGRAADDPARGDALALIEFLLSPDAQRLLVLSDSRNTPVDPALADEFKAYAIQSPLHLDLNAVADKIDRAMVICDEVFGR